MVEALRDMRTLSICKARTLRPWTRHSLWGILLLHSSSFFFIFLFVSFLLFSAFSLSFILISSSLYSTSADLLFERSSFYLCDTRPLLLALASYVSFFFFWLQLSGSKYCSIDPKIRLIAFLFPFFLLTPLLLSDGFLLLLGVLKCPLLSFCFWVFSNARCFSGG